MASADTEAGREARGTPGVWTDSWRPASEAVREDRQATPGVIPVASNLGIPIEPYPFKDISWSQLQEPYFTIPAPPPPSGPAPGKVKIYSVLQSQSQIPPTYEAGGDARESSSAGCVNLAPPP